MTDGPRPAAPEPPQPPPFAPPDVAPTAPSEVLHDASWGARTAIAAIAWFLFGQLLVSTVVLIAAVFVRGLPEHPDAGVAVEMALRDLPVAVAMAAALLGQLGALGGVAWLLRRRGVTSRGLGLVPVTGSKLMAGVGLGFAALIGTVFLTAILHALLGVDDAPTQELVDQAGSGTATTVFVLIIAVLAAPVLEELVFRGVLLPPLRSRFGDAPAVLLNGAVFALVHIELLVGGADAIPSMVSLTALGALLAWSAIRWRGLLVPIVTHAAFNGITLAIVISTG